MTTIKLQRDELDALDAYHLDKEIEYSRKGDYLDAEDHKRRRAELAKLQAQQPQAEPIPMVLYCPNCGKQHIDGPEEHWDRRYLYSWENPPHRSHKCHGCGTIWRPADVPTTGVASIETKGKADTWSPGQQPQAAGVPDGWRIERRSDDRIKVTDPSGESWSFSDTDACGTSNQFVYALLNDVLSATPSSDSASTRRAGMSPNDIADALDMQVRTFNLSGRNDFTVSLMEQAANALRATPPAQAQGVEAVADVPIHPRQGPLWANVRPRGADTPMPSYPMRPLMYADHPSALKRLSAEQVFAAYRACEGSADSMAIARAIEDALAAHNGMGVE